MKIKIFTFLFAFGVALFGVNWLLWQWDEPVGELTKQITSEVETNKKPDAKDYSVEKLNSQATIKQLRQALFSEPDVGELEIDKLDEKEFNNLDSGHPVARTAAELDYELKQLSQELQELQESVQ